MSGWAWLAYAIGATLLWRLWGLFGKLASRSVSPQNLVLVSNIGWVIVLPISIAAFWRSFDLRGDAANTTFAVLSGVASSVGGLLFCFALARGEASRVVAVTATYPIVTLVLARFLLAESITADKAAGVALALAGVLLLSR